jgi:glutamine amidotransferase
MICIVDYGLGNPAAIHNMLRRIGIESTVSGNRSELAGADKLILPGVGAFDEGMRNLRSRDLVGFLDEQARDKKKPILGICLGMQLIGESSEEGDLQGLGFVPMRFQRFRASVNSRTKTLHMGWNEVQAQNDSPLLGDFNRTPSFYFVHGFFAVCAERRDVLGTSSYGVEFPSVVGRDNVLGVQFHPEKSHRFGMQLLRNFAEAG